MNTFPELRMPKTTGPAEQIGVTPQVAFSPETPEMPAGSFKAILAKLNPEQALRLEQPVLESVPVSAESDNPENEETAHKLDGDEEPFQALKNDRKEKPEQSRIEFLNSVESSGIESPKNSATPGKINDVDALTATRDTGKPRVDPLEERPSIKSVVDVSKAVFARMDSTIQGRLDESQAIAKDTVRPVVHEKVIEHSNPTAVKNAPMHALQAPDDVSVPQNWVKSTKGIVPLEKNQSTEFVRLEKSRAPTENHDPLPAEKPTNPDDLKKITVNLGTVTPLEKLTEEVTLLSDKLEMPRSLSELQITDARTPIVQATSQTHYATPQNARNFTANATNIISDAVLTLREAGGQIDVTLSPEDLGRLNIKLEHTVSGTQITFSAEKLETQELMRRQIEHLQSQFKNMGFENLSFSFEQNRGDGEDKDEGPSTNAIPEASTPDQDQTQLLLVTSTGGLDIRI